MPRTRNGSETAQLSDAQSRALTAAHRLAKRISKSEGKLLGKAHTPAAKDFSASFLGETTEEEQVPLLMTLTAASIVPRSVMT